MRSILSAFLIFAVFVGPAGSPAAPDDPAARIAALEAAVRQDPGRFDWTVHNELRHLYMDRDERKSLLHCDIILRNRPLDGYTLDAVGGREAGPRGVERLRRAAAQYPEYKALAAACLLREAEWTTGSLTARRSLLRKAAALEGEGLDPYRLAAAATLETLDRPVTTAPWTVPVLVLRYFPPSADGKRLDALRLLPCDRAAVENLPLAELEARCTSMTRETVHALEEGSRFRPYADPQAPPSLKYDIRGTLTFYEALPPHPDRKSYADYNKMLERVGIRDWVESKGVREVWIWAYHSDATGLVESNMASVHGNVSNSIRDPRDLPVLRNTYTVYHYNYARGANMAVHNHIHQIEAVMDARLGPLWPLFTGKPGAWRAGNCHFPPNAAKDYDYGNPAEVETDIEDWRPEGFGRMQRISSSRWAGDDMQWYVYWMQSLPGARNGLTFRGKPLGNWWELVGDYDQAVVRGFGAGQ